LRGPSKFEERFRVVLQAPAVHTVDTVAAVKTSVTLIVALSSMHVPATLIAPLWVPSKTALAAGAVMVSKMGFVRCPKPSSTLEPFFEQELVTNKLVRMARENKKFKFFIISIIGHLLININLR
jgi:hypothetical protein